MKTNAKMHEIKFQFLNPIFYQKQFIYLLFKGFFFMDSRALLYGAKNHLICWIQRIMVWLFFYDS